MYTEQERRQNRRAKVDLAQTGGEFNLELNGKHIPILGSNHISISGMDIQTPAAAQPNSNIKLHFRTRDLHLAVKGQVAWCAARDDDQHSGKRLYTMGIEFDPTTLDDNSLLFLALREYVDAFE